ncbi:hypothetical protein FRC01_000494 [Tulasnella sp. 417]|nr:hypothetical protein FRC01_000494 [Tulasnella sp. 417]
MANVFLSPQPQPQPNREYGFDDPYAPLRLPPLAQIGEFWRRYDRLADIHDKKLTTNLNGNLDVLLIFAALFSAINTTFISITMPDLSPNPSDETNTLLRLLVMKADNNTLTSADLAPSFSAHTNSIIVNSLLYASLSCSLLAAVGAMMAKEWLQSFDRTGQTGPLEDQARVRQGKLTGVLEWHLEAVIKFLPNLLLLSVIFFFVGVCIFLFPINMVVAGIVIAFSGIGVVFSGIVIVAGALSPTCPYQSAASSALRRVCRALEELGRMIWRSAVFPVCSISREVLSNLFHVRASPLDRASSVAGSPELSISRALDEAADLGAGAIAPILVGSERTLTVQAARWLLETTSNRGDQISTIQFLCSLDRTICASVFDDDDSWKRLLSLTIGAFEIWHSQPDKENQEVAELFGLAFCRVLLHCPHECDKWKDITGESSPLPRSFGKAFIQTVTLALKKYSSQTAEDDQRILHIAAIYTAVTQGIDFNDYQWLKPCCLLDGHSVVTTALLGMWTILSLKIGHPKQGPPPERYERDFEAASSSPQELGNNLGWALHRICELIRSLQGDLDSELNAAQGFAISIQRARELYQTNRVIDLLVFYGLGDLIWSYIDHLTTSGSTEIRLVKLSVEALLTFTTFLPPQPHDSDPPSAPGDELTSSRALIDTIADVLLDDLSRFTNHFGDWKSRARTFKACIIRIFLWIWRNDPHRNSGDHDPDKLLVSSCRLWAPLEKEVDFSKTGTFDAEDKPLTPDDLKGVAEFTQWVQTHTLSQIKVEDYHLKRIQTFNFIVPGADVGINRLYAHFDHRAEWDYHLYDFHEEVVSCSRSVYAEDGML